MKKCIDAPNYEIAEDGNVFHIRLQRRVSASMRPDGYVKVQLLVDGINKSFFVHRLLAKAYLINKKNYPCINHKNGMRSDNRIENLEWCTMSMNSRHSAWVLGRKNQKINKEIAKEIRALVYGGIKQKICADMFNISNAQVSRIVSNQDWVEYK